MYINIINKNVNIDINACKSFKCLPINCRAIKHSYLHKNRSDVAYLLPPFPLTICEHSL